MGSPPRMRGKGGQERKSCRRSRITPACAGKRLWQTLAVTASWDHPRVCGEKPFSQLESTVPPGSPPRMRGKVILLDFGLEPVGITPACAGKRTMARSTFGPGRDHPCVCGEKSGTAPPLSMIWGSPPRVRGKGNVGTSGVDGVGITPACAGKSPAMMVCSLEYWGSPPRMRGKAVEMKLAGTVHGITPACAGKSC